MITYRKLECRSHLRNYVRAFWALEYTSSNDKYVHRQIPDGCAELLFNYKGSFDVIHDDGSRSRTFTSGIHAPSDKVKRFYISDNFGLFGVYLYPYSLSVIFGVPSHELKNTMPDLLSLVGVEGAILQEKIMKAENFERRIQIISDFLSEKIMKIKNENDQLQAAFHTIIRLNGNVNVKALAYDFNVSLRQLERNFKEHSGFSPKAFSKILRFRSAIEALNGQYESLADIAYRYGYYDQSHFTNDFKLLSGYSPREYLLDRSGEQAIY